MANGTIVATDPEGDSITYSIIDLSNTFMIDPITGVITTTSVTATAGNDLDFERTPTYSATVVATDSGSGSQTTLPIQITVIDVNEPPVLGAFGVAPVDEDTAVGAVVDQVTATDDDNDPLVFSITGGTGQNVFSIDPATGEITLIQAVNFEITPSFTLDIEVTDDGTPALTDTRTVAINITDVNEAPVLGAFGVAPVDEDTAVGAVVDQVTATDDDNDPLVFSITGGTGQNVFSIDPATGEITLIQAVNFEITPSYTLEIEVIDDGTPALTDTRTATINIGDINEPPVLTTLSIAPIDENTAAGIVGQAIATDADNDTLVYSITGGQNVFSIDPATGEITLLRTVDAQITPSFTLDIEVIDDGTPPLTDTTTVTINIGDINEAPSIAPGQTLTIGENTPSGTLTTGGPILATDPDSGATLTFGIVDPTGLFTIVPNTGEIVRDAAALDFEALPSPVVTVTVTVTDQLGLTSNEAVDITVLNQNDAPQLVTLSGPMVVTENDPAQLLGKVTATDQDTADILTYSLSGIGANLFNVNANGEISTLGPLDFETQQQYNLVLTVTDDGAPALSVTTPLVVDVLPVNEAPVLQILGTPVNVPESNGPGSNVMVNISAQDPEGDQLNYTLNDPSGLFAINGTTGVLSVANPVDFETAPNTYVLTVTVDDLQGAGGTSSVSGDVIIQITNVDEAPVIDTNQAFTIVENLGQAPVSGVVTFTDPENDPVTTWSISDPSNNFTIDAATGQILSRLPLDFEAVNTPLFLVDVTATGSGGTSTESVTIELLNVLEPPTLVRYDTGAAPVPGSTYLPSQLFGVFHVDNPENLPLVFTVTGGTAASAADIDPVTGEVFATGGSPGVAVNPILDVRVEYASDPTLFDSAAAPIVIANANAPLNRGLTFTISENAPVGATITPPAQALGGPVGPLPFRYELVQPSGPFVIDSTSGVITLASGSLDLETQNSYPITIQLWDDSASFPLRDEWTTTVQIQNVNEDPELLVPAVPFSVDEHAPIGTPVGTLSVFDIDAGDTHLFLPLGGTDSPFFNIDPLTGEITTSSNAIDFETDDMLEVDVTVLDALGLLDMETITIVLNDTNDPPVIDISQSFQIEEFSAAGTPLTKNVAMPGDPSVATAVDPNVGDSIVSWAITGGTGQGLFDISPTGEITVNTLLDINNGNFYDLELTATDNGNPAASGVGTVSVSILPQQP